MSNLPPSEVQISEHARQLWEEEGQPEGKAEEHWARAQEQLRNAPQNTDSTPETVA